MAKWRWIIVVILLLALVLTGCKNRQDLPKISFSDVEKETVKVKAENGAEPLRVAIAAVISSTESIIYYEDLLDYLGATLDRPIELVYRKTYSEVNDLLRVGQVDMAFICTYAYILGKNEFNLELLAAPVINGKPTYQSYFIVPGQSKAENLDDLQGKRFAFTDPISFTGRLYPMYVLKKKGYSPQEYFSEIIYTYSHDNSIKAVAQNLVDGAAVDGLILEYLYTVDPSYLTKIKIIHKSDEFGMPPVVVPPGLDEDLKGELQQFFTSLHLNENSRAILDKILIEEFVLPEDKDYKSIEEIVNAVIDDES
ncbi:MAG: phosphate/phosphite/phosphonate ABC transporter substrate-binding protein [Bacillota bacterium]